MGNFLKIVDTATGSVDATMAPKSNAWISGIPKIALIPIPMRNNVMITPATA